MSAHSTPTGVTPGKVVALGHHLRADQHVDLAARDAREHRLAPCAPLADVAIEPRDPRRRKLRRRPRRRPARSRGPCARSCRGLACPGTRRGHALREAAVVAQLSRSLCR